VIIKNDDPRMIHLQNHFDYLNKLSLARSEPQNRLQQWLMEHVAMPLAWEDTMGYRNCYYRYMESLGFKVKVGPNRTLTAECAEGTEDTCFVLSTYYSKWKTDCPGLKVSRPAEDVCYYWYTFANKTKILSNHTNTTADEEGVNEELFF